MKMAKFRKRPVVIEAEQMPMDPNVEGIHWPDGVMREPGEGKPLFIETLEGPHIVTPGDWIITGVKGEKYPCKPDIFEMTYEPAE